MRTFFIDALELTAPISVLIGILLIFSPLTKKIFVAKWRYYMWLFVAVRLILPFKVSLKSTPITVTIPSSLTQMQVIETSASDIGIITPQTLLTLIWIIGIIVFAAINITSYIIFKNSVRRWSKSVTDETTLQIFEDVKSEIVSDSKIDLKICKSVSTPMIFGCIRPVLLLPECTYSKSELEIIFRHELVHQKRKDIIYKLILMIANCIHWFNPFVYMMVNSANKDIELVCDGEVVKECSMDYRRSYCETILKVVHNTHNAATPLSTCFIISRKVIQERFLYILDLKKRRKGVIMLAVVAFSIIVSGSMVSFATEKTAQVLEENLNIIERPVPKPISTEKPAVTALPTATQRPAMRNTTASVRTYENNSQNFAEATQTPHKNETENKPINNADKETPLPSTVPENIVDLSQKSNQIRVSFNEKGETFSTVGTYVGDNETEMVVVGDVVLGSCEFTVQVVDKSTGEVVHEHTMTDEDNSFTIPMNGKEYSLNATSNDNTEAHTRILVYGK